MEDLAAWLRRAVEHGASDLHLTVESPPVLRVNGELVDLEGPRLRPEDVRRLVEPVLDERSRAALERDGQVDFAYSLPGVGRFRVNVYRQRGSLAAALRLIPMHVPPLESLGLPASVDAFCELAQGLVLVTGPTGHGKSTTLAAMVDRINHSRRAHVVTLEDPIEYLHRHDRSLVDQREIGLDAPSFAAGLRAALREDPDVIMVGEMRDLETIAIALTAAETGHLVLATLHTPSAPLAVDRIVDVFPAEQQNQVRVQLAGVLEGIVAQRLVPSSDGRRRYPVAEVLVATHAVRNLIREGKTAQLASVMESSRQQGMVTLRESAGRLLAGGLVTPEALVRAGVRP
ncbi:MAG: type IV pilus twitching motility protein PilT [Clostridia bacterium]|nr:type IV pilus twitching motility protein PilT [Clostridia bacterium]